MDVSSKQILEATASRFGMTLERMLGARGRRHDLERLARWAAAHRLREHLRMSTTQIARLLRYRDHTTIMVVLRKPSPWPPAAGPKPPSRVSGYCPE